MSNTTLRYYNSTLAYKPALPQRRIRAMRKKIRTRISRRRVKQQIQKALHKLHLN